MLNFIMLSVIMLNVILLSVIMLNVIMLSVMVHLSGQEAWPLRGKALRETLAKTVKKVINKEILIKQEARWQNH